MDMRMVARMASGGLRLFAAQAITAMPSPMLAPIGEPNASSGTARPRATQPRGGSAAEAASDRWASAAG